MQSKQSGNAILFVLMGVILFGLLAYTFIKSAKTGQGNLTKHQDKIMAVEMINTASTISKAIEKLRQRGCSENQISLQRDWNGDASITNTAADLYNANAPTDKSCHLFDTAGANVTYSQIGSYDYTLSGSVITDGLGCSANAATCADLNFVIESITPQICEQINLALQYNFSSIPVDNDGIGDFTAYTGSFSNAAIVGDDDATNLSAKRSACFHDNAGSTGYIFYTTLIER